ncbi:MAG: hypothetical protein WA421_00770 [Nitrososphaeraceae archaeon]
MITMPLSQRQSQKRKKKVKEGIEFVLNHFPKDNTTEDNKDRKLVL